MKDSCEKNSKYKEEEWKKKKKKKRFNTIDPSDPVVEVYNVYIDCAEIIH